MRRNPQRLADCEQADSDDDDVDAVGQLWDPEGEPLLPRGSVDADETDGEPDAERREPTHPRAAEDRGYGDEREHRDGEVVRRADLHRDLHDRGREQHHEQGSDGARDERPDGCRGQRL